MPAFVAYIGATILTGLGVSLVGSAAVIASLVVGSAVLGLVTYSALRQSRLKDNIGTGAASHQLTVRSTTEPRKIVYGEALVSGPIAYLNTSGNENRSLYAVIALTGHESQSFQGAYLDTKFVPIADVSTLGGGGDGSVTADTNSHGFGPAGSNPVLYIREHLGTSGQTVDSMLDSAFTDIGTDHRMRGCTYVVFRLDKIADGTAWQNGMPGNLSILLRGKKVYDPRLDGTFSGTWGTGSGAQRVATPSTWAYSANPALCLADYLIDSDLGAGFASARIDYDSVALAADVCDTAVAIPSTTQTRFTCNGVLTTAETHRENIEKILSSMAGTLRYYNGQWRVRAGSFASSDFTLDQSHLIGSIKYQDGPQSGERFNAVRGVYFDPSRQYKESQYLTVNDTTTRAARDTGLVLYKDLDLPMTNHEYMAQRVAFRALNQAVNTGICVFPTGYNGLNIAPGDTGTVTIPELGWSSKVFRCVGLRHVDMVGVELILKEDSSTAYADPASGDYGTRSAAGAVSPPVAPAHIAGIIRDPNFGRAITDSWLVTSGAGVSISSGGGENGGNALVMTTSGSTVQAAINQLQSETSPGEVLAGQLRAKITTNVTAVNVRLNYYRSDTGASLGSQDYAVTAGFVSTGTYYTIPWRLWTPASYTIGAGARILVAAEIRMTPSGGGTATLTVSGISGDRLGVVGTSEIDANATSALSTATAASTSITNQQHSPDGQGFNTQIVSVTITPSVTCDVEVTVSGSISYTMASAHTYADLQYSIQQDSAYDAFQEKHWYFKNPAATDDFSIPIGHTVTFVSVTGGASTTFKFMAAFFNSDDVVAATNMEMRVQQRKR